MDCRGNGLCRFPQSLALSLQVPRRRAFLYRLLFAILLGLISIVLGESVLRLFWRNPGIYSWNDYSGYVRLLPPHQEESYDVTGLYAGAGRIRFRTGALGQILNTGSPGNSWAIGGSTTECRYVSENFRWPDQVQPYRLTNFGSSGCALGDLYFNLEFLFAHSPVLPEAVLLMEAVNDLSAWKDYLASGGDLQVWARVRSRFHTTSRDARSVWGRKVWLIAWYASVRDRYPLRHFASWTARDYYLRLRAKSSTGRAQAPLSTRAFDRFQRGPFEEFLRYREEIFKECLRLVSSRGAELILLTQPNAFRADYQPFEGIDLRDTPELEGGFASYPQTRTLLQAINQQTREWSQKYGLRLVDLEKEFEKESASRMLYDSVHYTAAGSEKVARLINRLLIRR